MGSAGSTTGACDLIFRSETFAIRQVGAYPKSKVVPIRILVPVTPTRPCPVPAFLGLVDVTEPADEKEWMKGFRLLSRCN